MKRIFICIVLIALFTGPFANAGPNNALLLESDPNSFFEAPNHDVFHNKLGNQLTVEAWVFVNNQAGERMIVNKEDSYEFAAIDGVFQSALNGGGGWNWFSSAIQIKPKEWTHVAMAWDGKDVRMFVNGKEGVRVSKVVRYKGKYDVQQGAFEPDDDTVALYHFDEEVGGKIKDFSKSGVDGKLVGKAKLVPSNAPTVLPVEARGKLATVWGRLKY
ncbi:LamG domain-containing protein [Candidatus Poribacteria bacterium]|nr:LamG domain-containing protein [Candidatus Poribacteria bacterium]